MLLFSVSPFPSPVTAVGYLSEPFLRFLLVKRWVFPSVAKCLLIGHYMNLRVSTLQHKIAGDIKITGAKWIELN